MSLKFDIYPTRVDNTFLGYKMISGLVQMVEDCLLSFQYFFSRILVWNRIGVEKLPKSFLFCWNWD